MLAEERYRKIMELLRKDRAVKVAVLTELFGVSTETVRRDLDYLEKEGCLKKVYGGAVLDQVDTSEPKFQEREYWYEEEKSELAQLACRLIREKDSVALDSGTTNLKVARALKKSFESLTILTNSIPVMNELIDKGSFNVIFTGGVLDHGEKAVIGENCLAHLKQYRVNYYFMTPSGISLHSGFTSYGFGEVEVQRAMIDIAGHTIALCNSSCFDKVCLMKICDLIRAESVISDSELSREIKERYETAGINLITP
jgi:DeoR family fructose operon transcriptional repressor